MHVWYLHLQLLYLCCTCAAPVLHLRLRRKRRNLALSITANRNIASSLEKVLGIVVQVGRTHTFCSVESDSVLGRRARLCTQR